MSTPKDDDLDKDLDDLRKLADKGLRALLMVRNMTAPGWPPQPGKLSAAELSRRLGSDVPFMSRPNLSLQLAIWNYAAEELKVLPHSELLRSRQGLEDWAEENDVVLENGWPQDVTWDHIHKSYKSHKRDSSDAKEGAQKKEKDPSEFDIDALVTTTLENLSAMLSKVHRELRIEFLDRLTERLSELYPDEDNEADDEDDGSG